MGNFFMILGILLMMGRGGIFGVAFLALGVFFALCEALASCLSPGHGEDTRRPADRKTALPPREDDDPETRP